MDPWSLRSGDQHRLPYFPNPDLVFRILATGHTDKPWYDELGHCDVWGHDCYQYGLLFYQGTTCIYRTGGIDEEGDMNFWGCVRVYALGRCWVYSWFGSDAGMHSWMGRGVYRALTWMLYMAWVTSVGW